MPRRVNHCRFRAFVLSCFRAFVLSCFRAFVQAIQRLQPRGRARIFPNPRPDQPGVGCPLIKNKTITGDGLW